MIPILFDAGETAFSSNGLGRLLDCTRCVVTEERNGEYECEFDYPITGEMYSEIKEGRTIVVTHDDGHDTQPFDIYGRSAPLGGVVTFYAHHLSYRLNNVILRPFTASSCITALEGMATNTYNGNPFTFWTDKSTQASWTLTHPASVREKLAGSSGSILDVYGRGEYEFDGWTVRLYIERGNDNGVSIRYGVNLSDLLHTYDQMDTYTAVAPYYVDGEDGSVVMLPEGIVISPNVPPTEIALWEDGRGGVLEDGRGNQMEMPSVAVVPVSMDLSESFDERPTVAQLRAEAMRRLNSSEAWLPSENLTVSFVDLAHTTEYESVSALQRVRLCDKVSVYCGPLGVSAVKMQVIKTVYNVLTETYDEIEIGKPKQSFADTIMQSVDSAVAAATAGLITTTQLQDAIDNATMMISGAKDSHVVLVHDANGGLQEILIMDTEDINTAVNVWRWNSGGLGFSSNGYAGPYSTAITADGSIVADMITTGKLGAAYIDADNLHVKAANIDGTLVIGQLPSTVAETSDIPTAVSQLSNDSGYQNSTQVTTIANGVVTTAQINAGQITAGTMSAARIKGGTLKLGGSGNGNGVLEIYDASDTKIGYWDNTGIHATVGTFSGTVSAGKITGGSITGTSISNRSGSALGFEVGEHGDVAIGVKPDDMSSFDGNKCPFQISNWGRMKCVEVQLWAANASGVYERIGRLTTDYTNQRIIFRDNKVDIYEGLNVNNGLTVANGGMSVTGAASITGDTDITGDATVSGSMTAAEYVGLTLTDANWVRLRAQLRKITVGNSMAFACASSITSYLTGSKVSAIVFGTVYRATDLIFEFTARQLNVAYEFAWRVTFGNDAGTNATVGTVYRFTGAAI